MKKDFHYSVIKILAKRAGFNEKDSQKIAHASQYVDDATSYKPLRIIKPPDLICEHDRYDKQKREFDPICTAHKLFGYITGLDSEVQKKVYVSFHFIPEKDLKNIQSVKHKHYVTKKNGELVNELMDKAVDELIKAENSERDQKLIKLGIIIHSYADTWSHQGFSGIHSPYNDITNLQFKSGGKLSSVSYGYRPDIGHAEADDFPDTMNLEWQYEYDETNNTVGAITKRNNSTIFLDASENIFQYLCKARNEEHGKEIWDVFKNDLAYCLKESREYDSDLKQNIFYDKFPDVNLSYNENIWMSDAINDRRHDWFYFHIEAYNQRQYIVNM